MWKILRISILLAVLVWAAGHTWLDRVVSTRWKDTLWVGVFPVNGDGTSQAQKYLDNLSEGEFQDIEPFVEREAHRYGRAVSRPVHVVLYREVKQQPPALNRDAGPLESAWWSLKMRW